MIDKGFSNGDMMEIDVDEVLHTISHLRICFLELYYFFWFIKIWLH